MRLFHYRKSLDLIGGDGVSTGLTSCHWRLLVITLALALTGCGGAYDATVNGVVTLNGQPLTRGNVAFIANDKAPAYARIDSSGEYEVYTGREVGLPSGSYTVTVVSREPAAVERSELGGPPPPGKSLTPAWYANPSTSGLSYTVESGDNEINIELNSTPPPGWKPRGARG
jgi:hypothetical protein